ncbi:tryptophan 7-halogenase [Shewanella oncorhynchi]|uniref:tryptophan 7-halogenase n=1 Tax=Shewanella oncorhynchi TaxID=2726434 RepID=UPI003D79244E
MNNSPLKSITIVGGGSTGWMTALYLSKLYNHSSNIIDIRLIESKEIGIIGVGEATVHSPPVSGLLSPLNNHYV